MWSKLTSYINAQMVASDSGPPTSNIGGQGSTFSSTYRLDSAEAGTTLSKLRHTLTSGIHGTVNKLSPTRPPSASTHDSGISSSTSSLSSGATGGISSSSLSSNSTLSFEERSLLQKVWEKAERYEPPESRLVGKQPLPISTPTAPVGGTFSPLSPPINGGHTTTETPIAPSKPSRPPGSTCRVCVKTISDSEYFRRCSECNQKVCEDCASYSATKEGNLDIWHCSICRRKLLSRGRKDNQDQKMPNSESSLGLSNVDTNVSTNLMTPSASATLSLVTGIASMASLAASTPTTTVVTTTSSVTSKIISTSVPATSESTVTTVSNTITNPPVSKSTMVSATKPATEAASKEETLPNGVPRRERRVSRAVPQRSVERSTSKEDMLKERRASTAKRGGKDLPQRGKPSVVRRRSDNEDELKHAKPAITAARRGHRVSDFMLREPSEDKGPSSVTIKAKGETDSLLPTNQRPPPEPQKPPVTSESTEGVSALGGSGDSSGEDNSSDSRRGRRRGSIVRQKSCDEDVEDNSFLNLWSSGQLPVRRHSAQDPSRKPENPDFQRGKESLDVPQGRAHRHHSWDYDISRGSNQGHDSLLPNSTIPAQSSRFSSESDMSNESTSERGSTLGLTDDLLRRGSRIASTNRRSSYRGNREEEEVSIAPSDTNVAASGADAAANRRAGTSSLEDDPWLHPTDDEWRSSRRRSSAVSDSGRVLPTPPASPRIQAYASSWASGGSSSGGGIGRTSTSVESSSSRDLGDEAVNRQSSVAEGEAIKIVIHDVDTDFPKSSKLAQKKEEGRRKVKLKRILDDASHRGGGVGMRIVGGKVSSDGSLMASVVWVIPGGPADCAGVRQGDKVLEWNGVSLVNRSFEDVCAIIEADEGNEMVEMVIEPSTETGSNESSKDENPLLQSQRSSLEHRGSLDSDLEKSLMSVSRRKLPKIPGDLLRAPVSGKIQVQIWFDKTNSQLITTVLSAHDLRHREGYVPPDAFASLRLVPHTDCNMYTTPVADPSTKPLWNASFLWENISGDSLMGMTLELSVWDYITDTEKGFLGECLIDLRHAYLDERPTWYRLQERRSRSANTTPRGSLAGYDFVMPIVRRPSSVKSGSEDYHDRDDSRHSSIDSGLLHPDLAWRDSRSNSRRGSSVSEHGESEVYQLTRSYPHSLPQSRRSSFAYQSSSPDFRAEELEERLNTIYPPERRRAHSVRVGTQRELLQEAGWRNFNQTPYWLGASSILYQGSSSNLSAVTAGCRRGRSNSLMGDLKIIKGSSKMQHPEEDLHQSWRTNLGPGQVVPRAYRAILTDDFTLGEIRLELSQTRGSLEVEVSNARGLPEADSGQPPDTYVKTYLKEGDKRMQKRKTRVIKQSRTPNFYQTLRYPSIEVTGRTLLVMVWEKKRGIDHNIGLGVAEIAVNKMELQRPVTGWYRLLPVSSIDRVGNSDSD